MGKIFKKAASVGAAILLAGTVLLSGAPANAGAQLGTIGQGSTYYPTASPYISYARVTQCMPAWGTPNMALVYQGRVSPVAPSHSAHVTWRGSTGTATLS